MGNNDGLMKFYRYNDWHQDNGEFSGLKTTIELEILYLFKNTPCGYWVRADWDREGQYKKWVSATGRKRFCYPTKEEAWLSFQCRKSSQYKYASAALRRVEATLKHMEGIDSAPEKQEWEQAQIKGIGGLFNG